MIRFEAEVHAWRKEDGSLRKGGRQWDEGDDSSGTDAANDDVSLHCVFFSIFSFFFCVVGVSWSVESMEESLLR